MEIAKLPISDHLVFSDSIFFLFFSSSSFIPIPFFLDSIFDPSVKQYTPQSPPQSLSPQVFFSPQTLSSAQILSNRYCSLTCAVLQGAPCKTADLGSLHKLCTSLALMPLSRSCHAAELELRMSRKCRLWN